ncbi:16754_t:CDS:2 [Acaulospora colombiana]|uniref:16754_t:CDS:1 n=1 Tax=Acaulospora colombiana TaxID=27376 RepID=A0ACA9K9G4_9GLOM|nr:16754_t:CDS:2 [Acaulospora colombiana]
MFVKVTAAISQRKRETPVAGTPPAYQRVYELSWNDEPTRRPTITYIHEEFLRMLREQGISHHAENSNSYSTCTSISHHTENSNSNSSCTSVSHHAENSNSYSSCTSISSNSSTYNPQRQSLFIEPNQQYLKPPSITSESNYKAETQSRGFNRDRNFPTMIQQNVHMPAPLQTSVTVPQERSTVYTTRPMERVEPFVRPVDPPPTIPASVGPSPTFATATPLYPPINYMHNPPFGRYPENPSPLRINPPPMNQPLPFGGYPGYPQGNSVPFCFSPSSSNGYPPQVSHPLQPNVYSPQMNQPPPQNGYRPQTNQLPPQNGHPPQTNQQTPSNGYQTLSNGYQTPPNGYFPQMNQQQSPSSGYPPLMNQQSPSNGRPPQSNYSPENSSYISPKNSTHFPPPVSSPIDLYHGELTRYNSRLRGKRHDAKKYAQNIPDYIRKRRVTLNLQTATLDTTSVLEIRRAWSTISTRFCNIELMHDMFLRLKQYNADFSVVSKDLNKTAFHHLFENKSTLKKFSESLKEEYKKVVRFLVENGCNVDALDSEGKTILAYYLEEDNPSLQRKYEAMISILLRNGANPNIRIRIKSTPEFTAPNSLYMAVKYNWSKSLFDLLCNYDVNSEEKDDDGNSILLLTLKGNQEGRYDKIRWVLENVYAANDLKGLETALSLVKHSSREYDLLKLYTKKEGAIQRKQIIDANKRIKKRQGDL